MNNSKGIIIIDYLEMFIGFLAVIFFLAAYIFVFNKGIKLLFIGLDIISFLFFMEGLDEIVFFKKNEF